jgi:hypothetical protein
MPDETKAPEVKTENKPEKVTPKVTVKTADPVPSPRVPERTKLEQEAGRRALAGKKA